MAHVPVPVDFPATLYDRLDVMAQHKGLSINAFVRHAVERLLSDYEDDLARDALAQQHVARGGAPLPPVTHIDAR